MRELVSYRIVEDILPIENADRIEIVKIGEWNVIAQKGIYSKGDKVVFFEIDSFLPVEERYEFLRKSSFKTVGEHQGFRIKTMKLKGVISQGLILPLSEFPELTGHEKNLTKKLNILHYDEIAYENKEVNENKPKVKRNIFQKIYDYFFKKKYLFPKHIIGKSSATRIQNCYSTVKNRKCNVTLKLDGSSCTFFKEKYSNKWQVASRNLVVNDSNHFTRMLDNLKPELKNISAKYKYSNISIQGELVGPSIQNNFEKLEDIEFYAFKAVINNKEYHSYELQNLLKDYNIKTVPLIDKDILIGNLTFDEWMNFVDNDVDSLTGKENTYPEGVVLWIDNHGPVKIISNKYLLKEG